MSDHDSHYELDDELLSAYLDGELSADERAAVEARLAADPAAQRLLHELRAVSQDVQSLPLEKVGRDLADDILRRAQAAKPHATKAESAGLGETLPKITVFGSTRSWMWASLALAAGLLIMFLQPGNEADKSLPAVAHRNEPSVASAPAEEAKTKLGRGLAVSPKPETAPTGAVAIEDRSKVERDSSGAPVAAEVAGESRSLAEGVASSAPAPPAVTATQSGDDLDRIAEVESGTPKPPAAYGAPDKLAISGAAGRARVSGGPVAPGFVRDEISAELKKDAQDLVVVRVLARPEALKNKSFDRLLNVRQIAFEPQPATEQPTSSRAQTYDGYETQLATRAARLADQSTHEAEADVVLVEAPEPVIESCLADLHKDPANFPIIEVDDASAAGKAVDEKQQPILAKKVGELSKYNRGVVPQRDKSSFHDAEHDYRYARSKESLSTVDTARQSEVGAEAGSGPLPKQKESLQPLSGQKESLGRARRLQSWYFADEPQLEQEVPPRAGGVGGRATTDAKTPASKQLRKLSEKSAPAPADNLRVLFVLRPDNPTPPAAPSPPPANPQK
jgi:anti-sigma factor RsiW